MKKLLLLAVIFSGAAFAAPCGAYSDFAANTAATNLSNALNGKLNVQCGTIAPSTQAGTAGIDAYINTTNGNFYICIITGTPCGNWFLLSSGGAGPIGPAGPPGPSIIDFRDGCQSTVSGSNFDSAAGVGNQAIMTSCDPANGSLDGYVSFPSGSTNHIQVHTYLSSTFTDGVAVQIVDWNTTAVSGAVVWQVGWQCVPVGGIASTTGYGTYTSFASSTARNVASHRNETNRVTLTTGCVPDSLVYFDIQLTSANNTLAGGADARLKWFRLGINQQ